MKRVFKIVLFVFALILLGLLGYFLITRPKKTVTTGHISSPLPTAEFVIPPPDAPKMSVPTDRETIDVANLYSNPVYKLPDGTITFLENSDFTMQFFPKDKSFSIAILNPTDLNAARVKAESAFLQTLEISGEQACQLTGFLGTPYSVSPKNSGINFGFSFCPDSIPFK